ncbi:MAG TPA: hypothetical protein VIM02_05545, partial [Rhizomicrobium sp.]
LRPSLSSKARLPQDAPFAGLLFDETGAAMLPTYSIKRGGLRYRYYASKPTLKGERSTASISRIPAPPFEAFMASTIDRLGLPRGDQVSQIRTVVQRIEVQANSIVIQFHRANVLASWRTTNPDAAPPRDREVIDDRRALLAGGETVADDGELLTLSLPVRARFRGGRTDILHPAGSARHTPRPDMPLVKAIARAHRWRQMLLDGEVSSIEALARHVKLDRGHVGRTLNLAFLSPALMRAIVRGEQPPGLRLTHLLAADIPLSWERQSAMFRDPAGTQ